MKSLQNKKVLHSDPLVSRHFFSLVLIYIFFNFRIHLYLLECLAEVCDHKNQLLKSDLIPVNRLISLIDSVQSGLAKSPSSESVTQECLDRLGQFLNCLLSAKLVHGKMSEVCASLNKMPVYKSSGNRLIKMFILRVKNQ